MKFAALKSPCRALLSVVTTTTVLVGAAACGSDYAPSEASKPPIDINQLNVGPYPTQPREFGVVATDLQARITEAARLAQYVPLPLEIDPAFTYRSEVSPRLYINGDELSGIMALDSFDKVAPEFIGGFISDGQTDPHQKGIHLINAVMIFPDQQKASEAARSLETADFEYNNRNQRVTIPKYPAAHSHWQPHIQSIGSWFASGNLVIYTWVYDYVKEYLKKVDLPALTNLVEKSLDRLLPALAEFDPTPPNRLKQAQADPDGMFRRMLPRTEGNPLIDPPAVYRGRGALHFLDKPAADRALFDELGVDLYAEDGTKLFRARDAEAAEKLATEINKPSKQLGSITPPEGLPTAKCTEFLGRDRFVARYYCAVAFDRYVAYTWSPQLTDVHQLISAQYRMMAEAN